MSRRSKRQKINFNKIKLKNSTRVSLVTLALFVFAISSANFYNSVFKTSSTTIQEDIYNYTNEYSSDYTVNIKSNPFIEEPSLPSGQTYVADLIDSLDINIDYKYYASEPSVVDYNYKIDAILVSTYPEDGKEYNVWNKTFPIKISEQLQSDNTVNINEKINIDYKKYHKDVKDFRQTMGMSLDSHLLVKLTVNTSTNIHDQITENQYVSDFSISLGDKIAIVEDKSENKTMGDFKNTNTINHNHIALPKCIFSLISMAFCLYIVYYISFKTRKRNFIKNEFKLELNRILKACQDRIVIVKNQVETDEENIIDVHNFGELIKLSEELYKPILCWISDDLNNEQAWFSVISNKIKYRFILKK